MAWVDPVQLNELNTLFKLFLTSDAHGFDLGSLNDDKCGPGSNKGDTFPS